MLDTQLGGTRGPLGQPSATDFLAVDLPPIVERFAEDFDRLTEPIPGRPDYRSLVAVGRLVPRVAVAGVLATDGTIVLMSIRFDLEADW